MATKQYAQQKDGLTFISGLAGLKPNRFGHIVPATGVVNYAFAEANVNCIILSYAARIGDAVSVLMLPFHNGTMCGWGLRRKRAQT